jgi:hypothetical protein
MRIEDRMLHYYPIAREPRSIAGHAVYDTEIVLNFCLVRREVLMTTRWDDSLKTSEHTDFFLRLAKTPWGVVHVPSVVAEHYPETTPVYQSYRASTDGDDRFDRKWRTGAYVYHGPGADTRSEAQRVRREYARGTLRHLRKRDLRRATGLLTAAAIAEARRLGRAS